MDEISRKAVRRNEEMRKPLSSVPPWKLDEPYPQPYYVFNDAGQDWEEARPQAPAAEHGSSSSSSGGGGGPDPDPDPDPPITCLALFSWNIDFMLPHARPRMGRDALFVDVLVRSGGGDGAGGGKKLIRLCNTHLESLAKEPALRPHQMRLAASYMRGSSGGGSCARSGFNRPWITDHLGVVAEVEVVD